MKYWYIGLIIMGLLLSIPSFFFPNKYKNQHFIIFLILLLSVCLETYGTYTLLRKINNTIAYNLFFIYLETILILLFFKSFLKTKIIKNSINMAMIAFLLWGVGYSLYLGQLDTFQTLSFTFGSLLIIICCIYFFVSIFLKDWFLDEKLILNPLFWISTFIFLFYTSTFLYFSSVIFLTDLDKNLILILSTSKRIMAVIMYLGMGLAFYLPYFNRSEKKN
ncbi:hypothetical protein [Belliella aquatica]|uniref:hypothetical protein n=2 Tax=Belliella aquatica TaxID=1323734 RepID=UPI001663D4AF|nr:hypothetical protein [Belliella aquatica]MCH7405494.1 hypothetical protein [Belliella aquatica]